MTSILYFLFWAGLFVVLMRFGCGAHVMGHGHHHDDSPSDGPKPLARPCGPLGTSGKGRRSRVPYERGYGKGEDCRLRGPPVPLLLTELQG